MGWTVPESACFINRSINWEGKVFTRTVTSEMDKLHHRMENNIKTSINQIRPGKFEEKHRFNERIEHLTLLYSSSYLATVISISVLQINVHTINFLESRGVEEEDDLFLSNFINTVGLTEVSEEVYWKGPLMECTNRVVHQESYPHLRETEKKNKLLSIFRNQFYQHS